MIRYSSFEIEDEGERNKRFKRQAENDKMVEGKFSTC